MEFHQKPIDVEVKKEEVEFQYDKHVMMWAIIAKNAQAIINQYKRLEPKLNDLVKSKKYKRVRNPMLIIMRQELASLILDDVKGRVIKEFFNDPPQLSNCYACEYAAEFNGIYGLPKFLVRFHHNKKFMAICINCPLRIGKDSERLYCHDNKRSKYKKLHTYIMYYNLKDLEALSIEFRDCKITDERYIHPKDSPDLGGIDNGISIHGKMFAQNKNQHLRRKQLLKSIHLKWSSKYELINLIWGVNKNKPSIHLQISRIVEANPMFISYQ